VVFLYKLYSYLRWMLYTNALFYTLFAFNMAYQFTPVLNLWCLFFVMSHFHSKFMVSHFLWCLIFIPNLWCLFFMSHFHSKFVSFFDVSFSFQIYDVSFLCLIFILNLLSLFLMSHFHSKFMMSLFYVSFSF
jgi:hypothetical protein